MHARHFYCTRRVKCCFFPLRTNSLAPLPSLIIKDFIFSPLKCLQVCTQMHPDTIATCQVISSESVVCHGNIIDCFGQGGGGGWVVSGARKIELTVHMMRLYSVSIVLARMKHLGHDLWLGRQLIEVCARPRQPVQSGAIASSLNHSQGCLIVLVSRPYSFYSV